MLIGLQVTVMAESHYSTLKDKIEVKRLILGLKGINLGDKKKKTFYLQKFKMYTYICVYIYVFYIYT
jgi:hypothetical protein